MILGICPVSREELLKISSCGISPDDLFKLINAMNRYTIFEESLIGYEEWKGWIYKTCGQFGLEPSDFFDEQEFLKRVKNYNARSTPRKKTSQGHIYIVESRGKFKIGKTKHLRSRIKKYVTENPDEITTVHCYPCADIDSEETRLHKMFSAKRFRNEWYSLDKQDLEYLKSISNA